MAEVIQLRNILRRERQLLEAEKKAIQSLSYDVGALSDKVFQSSWRARQRWKQLDLLVASRQTTIQCAARLAEIDDVCFRSSSEHQILGSEHLGELFLLLKETPEILARVLVYTDSCKKDSRPLVEVILSSVYGNYVLPEDEVGVLRLLDCLVALQLPACRQPKMFFRGVACAFTSMLSLFTEGLFAAKIYLAEALRDVTTQILLDDERYLEFEPSKLYTRVSAQEQRAWFTSDLQPKKGCDELDRTLDLAAAKVASYCMLVLQGLTEKLHCLPAGVRWLVARLRHRVIHLHIVAQDSEILPLLSDMVFGCFICPAMVMPEAAIVTADTPVSDTARYNLTQVARVLQGVSSAAFSRDMPRYIRAVYEKIDLSLPHKYIELILKAIDVDKPPPVSSVTSLSRNSVMLTEPELLQLLSYLQAARMPLSAKSVPPQLNILLNELKFLTESDKLSQTSSSSLTNSSPMPRPASYTAMPRAASSTAMPRPASSTAMPRSLSEVTRSASPRFDEDSAKLSPDVLVIPLTQSKPSGYVKLLPIAQVLKESPLADIPAAKLDTFGEKSSTAAEAFRHRSATVAGDQSTGVPPHGEQSRERSVSNSTRKQRAFSFVSTKAASSSNSGPSTSGQKSWDELRTPSCCSEVIARARSSSFGKVSDISDDADVLSADKSGDADSMIPALPSSLQGNSPEGDEVNSPDGGVSVAHSETVSVVSADQPFTASRVGCGDFMSETTSVASADASVIALAGSLSDLTSLGKADDLSLQGKSEVSSLTKVEAVLPQRSTQALAGSIASEASTDKRCTDSPDNLQLAGTVSVMALAGSLSDLSTCANKEALCAEETFVTSPPTDFQESSGTFPETTGLALANDRNVECGLVTDKDSTSVASTSQVSGTASVMALAGSLGDVSANTDAGVPSCTSQTSTKSEFMQDGKQYSSTFPSTTELSSSSGIMQDGASMTALHGSLETMSHQGSTTLTTKNISMLGFPTRKVQRARSTGAPRDTSNNSHNKFQVEHKPSSEPCKPSSEIVQQGGENSGDASTGNARHPAPPEKQRFWKRNPLSSLMKRKKEGDESEGSSLNTATHSAASQVKQDPKTSDDSADDITRKYERMSQEKANQKSGKPSDQEEVKKAMLLRKPSVCENWNTSPRFRSCRDQVSQILAEPPVTGFLPDLFDVSDLSDLQLPVTGNLSADDISQAIVLKKILQQQLSESLFLSQLEEATEIHDTLNLLNSLPAEAVSCLVESCKESYHKRSVYFAYLVNVKHDLLTYQTYLDTLLKHIERFIATSMEYFVSTIVRLFLERHIVEVNSFVQEFEDLRLSDEKSALVEEFLSEMYSQIEEEPASSALTEQQLHDSHLAVERACFSNIYRSAFMPNGETDELRDQLLHEHINKLAPSVTIHHRSLQILPRYSRQAPWPASMAILNQLTLHKAPCDKVSVIQRCCQSIMLLLSRAAISDDGEHSMPGADDFFPVLVYVVVHTNPPSLLSTVEYINNFMAHRMFGEQSYWWTQFSIAVEFIKTMEPEVFI